MESYIILLKKSYEYMKKYHAYHQDSTFKDMDSIVSDYDELVEMSILIIDGFPCDELQQLSRIWSNRLEEWE